MTEPRVSSLAQRASSGLVPVGRVWRFNHECRQPKEQYWRYGPRVRIGRREALLGLMGPA